MNINQLVEAQLALPAPKTAFKYTPTDDDKSSAIDVNSSSKTKTKNTNNKLKALGLVGGAVGVGDLAIGSNLIPSKLANSELPTSLKVPSLTNNSPKLNPMAASSPRSNPNPLANANPMAASSPRSNPNPLANANPMANSPSARSNPNPLANANPMANSPSARSNPNPLISDPSAADHAKSYISPEGHAKLANVGGRIMSTVRDFIPGATPISTTVGALGLGLAAKKFLGGPKRRF